MGDMSVKLEPGANGAGAMLTANGTPVAAIGQTETGDVVVTLAPLAADGISFRHATVRGTGQGAGGSTMANGAATFASAAGPPMVVDQRTGAPEVPPLAECPPLVGQDELLRSIAYAIKTGKHCAIGGPTGTGKTSAVRRVCAMTGTALVTVNVTPGMTADDFLGFPALSEGPNGNPTLEAWHGPFRIASRISQTHRTVLLIDEMSRIGNVSHYACLYPVLDGQGHLTVATDKGERIPVGDLTVIATYNPADDARTDYAGVTDLDPALSSRFGLKPTVGFPEPATEVSALRTRVPGIGEDEATAMVAVANRIRTATGIRYPMGFRTLMAWAEVVRDGFLGWMDAAVVTVVNDASADERDGIRGMLVLTDGQGPS